MYKSKDELKKYLEDKNLQQYIDKLAKKYKGKKVLGYGTGLLANVVLDNYDVSKLNIIGFADSKYLYEEESFRGCETFSPDKIQEINPDVILIFVYEDDVIRDFFEDNYSEINIPMIHIIKRTFLEKIKNLFLAE